VSLTSAFNPNSGATVSLAVLTTSAAVPAIANQTLANFRLANVGSNTVFLAFAPQGAAAPVATTATGMPMIGNSEEVFTLPPGTQIAAIAAATGNTLYVTAGEGL
jgi:hypothetical protein